MSELLKPRKTRKSQPRPIFHLLPRLPLEARIQIWQEATFDRLLTINGNKHYGYCSPTPTPAVTRACRESRKYSSYHKHFTIARKHPERYFWMNPIHDIIQIHPILIRFLKIETDDVTKLRTDVSDCKFWNAKECFFRYGGDLETYPFLELATFPGLKSVDVLVAGELAHWTNAFDDSWWDASTGPYTRIVSCESGEWIDATNCDIYWDWVENQGRNEGEVYSFTRMVNEEVKSCEERVRKVEEFKGLPRARIGYW